MARPKKIKEPKAPKLKKPKKVTPPKIDKRALLFRLVIEPKDQKRNFLIREFSMLKMLVERYSIEFVAALSFPKRFESVAIILCDSFKADLDRRFRAFNYRIDLSKYPQIPLSEDKFGDDFQLNKKPKTVRNFLWHQE